MNPFLGVVGFIFKESASTLTTQEASEKYEWNVIEIARNLEVPTVMVGGYQNLMMIRF